MKDSSANPTPPLVPPVGLKPYVAPALTLFGHVAALTRGGNCSANSDGTNNCQPGGNMRQGSMN